MVTQSRQSGHSSTVHLRLEMADGFIAVNQMGPDFLLVSETSRSFAPGEGTLFMSVDGNESRWKVRLPDGVSAGANRIVIANVD
jgi:hypothetical protein